ncbi:MAG TPA: PIG-L deacetylase family protein [Acidimicrobiales bacterium]|nr:PIG-L deacetylase family protein [Acidimicrobiales bacterium]
MGLRSALAVLAHPDDESFGLGAVLAHLVQGGAVAHSICFTRGEASSLGPSVGLGEVRARELAAASAVLGLAGTELLDYPDGRLAEVPMPELTEHVKAAARFQRADLLVVFDESGITGHPDHRMATAAGVAAGADLGLPVLAWTISDAAARRLNAEYGTRFVGRPDDEIDVVLEVDRGVQVRAIACHASQCADNPVLWARLALLGPHERLRWLRPPVDGADGTCTAVGAAPKP